MTIRSTDQLLLAETLNEARNFARISKLEDWIPFGVSDPLPVMHGLWRVIRPGVQVLIVRTFVPDGNPTVTPVLRPTVLHVLAGSYVAMAESPTGSWRYKVKTRDQDALLTPEMHYGMRPIETCIMLVVRLAPFPRSEPAPISHSLFRPGIEHVATLHKHAQMLLAS